MFIWLLVTRPVRARTCSRLLSLPTNILVFAVAMIVTLLAFFAVCQIMGVAVTWYMVAAAVVLGVFVAYAAMFGFDKFRQTLEQLDGIKKNN